MYEDLFRGRVVNRALVKSREAAEHQPLPVVAAQKLVPAKPHCEDFRAKRTILVSTAIVASNYFSVDCRAHLSWRFRFRLGFQTTGDCLLFD